MKKVYLAGPDVFRANAKEHGEKLKAICAKYGFEGLYPLDPVLEGLKAGDIDSGLKIYLSDIRLMLQADAVLANMEPFRGPSMDTGTAFEMGFMVASGKPVFGYSNDLRRYKEKAVVAQDAFPMIEDFGMTDNLMMVSPALMDGKTIYESFEDAAKALGEYFKERT